MYLKEIEKQKWSIEKPIKVSESNQAGIDLLEQELHINNIRCYDEKTQERKIIICCSDQTQITELSKSEYFTLKGVLISKYVRNKGYILQIDGELEPSGLTIRKKNGL